MGVLKGCPNNPAPNYELRTTVVPNLLDENDLLEMAQILEGADQFVLQQFQPLPTIIDPKLQATKPFSREQIEATAALCRRYVERVILRGF